MTNLLGLIAKMEKICFRKEKRLAGLAPGEQCSFNYVIILINLIKLI